MQVVMEDSATLTLNMKRCEINHMQLMPCMRTCVWVCVCVCMGVRTSERTCMIMSVSQNPLKVLFLLE